LPEYKTHSPPSTAYTPIDGTGPRAPSAFLNSSSEKYSTSEKITYANIPHGNPSPSEYHADDYLTVAALIAKKAKVPSSTFKSHTPQQTVCKSDVPASTSYNPQLPKENQNAATAAFRSGSPQFPEYKSDVPPCTTYDPHYPLWNRRTLPSSTFRSSTPRLPDGKASSPPSTAYNPTYGTTRAGPTSGFKSRTARLPDSKPSAPSPTAYNPTYASTTGRAVTSAFKSMVPRLATDTQHSPAPNQYDLSPAPPRRAVPSAWSASKSIRMPDPKTPAPGPGQYTYQLSTSADERRAALAAPFKSRTPRLPKYDTRVPGPGEYNADIPLKSRPSKSFGATSTRFNDPMYPVPPPGAYDPSYYPVDNRALFARHTFRSNTKRFDDTPQSSQFPGPGEYRVNYSSFLDQPYVTTVSSKQRPRVTYP
jgi:hypothetical protein